MNWTELSTGKRRYFSWLSVGLILLLATLLGQSTVFGAAHPSQFCLEADGIFTDCDPQAPGIEEWSDVTANVFQNGTSFVYFNQEVGEALYLMYDEVGRQFPLGPDESTVVKFDTTQEGQVKRYEIHFFGDNSIQVLIDGVDQGRGDPGEPIAFLEGAVGFGRSPNDLDNDHLIFELEVPLIAGEGDGDYTGGVYSSDPRWWNSTIPQEIPSFSVAPGGPSVLDPADIFQRNPGGAPIVLIPRANLGLALGDDLDALSYGLPDLIFPPVNWSTQPLAQGLGGSQLNAEAACPGPEVHGDEYTLRIQGGILTLGTNIQRLDENGVSCAGNAGLPFGLLISDNVDALDERSGAAVDANGDGLADIPVFFSLAPGNSLGVSPADVLLLPVGFVAPGVFASEAALGLVNLDDIDAMELLESGDGTFQPFDPNTNSGDILVFSLTAGSPTLVALPANPGDLLLATVAGPVVVFTANNMGMTNTDDLNALKAEEAFLVDQPPPPPPPDVALDHFKCYPITSSQGDLIDPTNVFLQDQFGKGPVQVEPAVKFCNPVVKTRDGKGTDIRDPNAHLKFYPILEQPVPIPPFVFVSNQFGDNQELVVLQSHFLAVPTQKLAVILPGETTKDTGLDAPTGLDHFKCYDVSGLPVNVTVNLQDQFHLEEGAQVFDPRLLCNPVDKSHSGQDFLRQNPDNHLVCYNITEIAFSAQVQARNQFGDENLTVVNADLLCVPSRKRLLGDGPGEGNGDPTGGGQFPGDSTTGLDSSGNLVEYEDGGFGPQNGGGNSNGLETSNAIITATEGGLTFVDPTPEGFDPAEQGGETSCQGKNSCQGEFISVGEGSCNEDNSCNTTASFLFIGANSCTEKDSCNGNDSTVGDNSCTGGKKVCNGDNMVVGDGSCTGKKSCKFKSNNNVVGDASCTGKDSCKIKGDGNEVGDASCTGKKSCDIKGNNNSIGNGSCMGEKSCKLKGSGIVINDNDCNGKKDCKLPEKMKSKKSKK